MRTSLERTACALCAFICLASSGCSLVGLVAGAATPRYEEARGDAPARVGEVVRVKTRAAAAPHQEGMLSAVDEAGNLSIATERGEARVAVSDVRLVYVEHDGRWSPMRGELRPGEHVLVTVGEELEARLLEGRYEGVWRGNIVLETKRGTALLRDDLVSSVKVERGSQAMTGLAAGFAVDLVCIVAVVLARSR
jgi:hypothetical protein